MGLDRKILLGGGVFFGAIALSLGSTLGDLWILGTLGCLFLFSGLIFLMQRKRVGLKERPNLLFWILFFLSFLGLFRGGLDHWIYYKQCNALKGYEGKLLVQSRRGEEGYEAKLLSEPKVRVLFYSEEDYPFGQILKVVGELTLPSIALNSHSFSYREYLRNQGIPFLLTIAEQDLCGRDRSFRSLLEEYKIYYLFIMKQHLGSSVKYLKSTFLGDYRDLDEKDRQQWQNLGITHLQAVSGAQAGALIDLVMLLYVLTPRQGWMKKLLFLCLLLMYGVLTSSPSVWRVLIGVTLEKIKEAKGWGGNKISIVILSGILMLLIWPRYLYQISFQLSFVIALGVMLYEDWLKSLRYLWLKGLASGLISMAFSFPLLLTYFQGIALSTLLATPIFSPLVQLIIIIGAVYLLFPWLSNWFLPLNGLLKGGIALLVRMVEFLNTLPLPFYVGAPMDWWQVCLFYLLLSLFPNKNYRKIIGFAALILLCLSLLLKGIPDLLFAKPMEVSFINVGQGDSILIETPKGGKVILVDGGKAFGKTDMGKQEVLPYLRRKGINRIDLLVSTHGDNDHMGGLKAITAEMQVGSVLIPPIVYDKDGAYLWLSRKYPGKIIEGRMGMSINLGGISIRILSPMLSDSLLSANDASLVLDVRSGDQNILLTGDCELAVLEKIAKENIEYEVVKAPHHGSSKSFRPGLYKDLGADVVVFSVGPNNYGHPGKEILQELTRAGLPIYRTDWDREVVLLLKGKEWVLVGKRGLQMI